MDWQYNSNWTSESITNIDLARGIVTYSKATSNGQFNRIYANTRSPHQHQGHLTNLQAQDFLNKYMIGERYLMLLRIQVLYEWSKFTNQTTKAFRLKYYKPFEESYLTMTYPVAQQWTTGFVRSALDKKKISDYIGKLVEQAYSYGMIDYIYENDSKERILRKIEQTSNSLRKIAFAAPKILAKKTAQNEAEQ